MTEAAGQFAGHDRAGGARGGRRRAARGGPDQPHRALHPRGPVLPALRRADRAADLAAVVHEDGRAGRAGDRRGRGRARAHPSRGPAQALPRLAATTSARGASRASCGGATRSRSGTAATRPTSASTRRAGPGWERDPDVLDTWFSSGLWPFATLGWPDQTDELKAFYPTDVLSTARDILFLWVARMVFIGLEFAGDIPFDDVYVHSIVQAPDGRRMSKSLGTGIDPLTLIDGGPRPPVFTEGGDFPAYGADAVRYGLLAMSSTQDVRFNEGTIAEGRQLANKLFNASRLVLLRVPEGVDGPGRARRRRRRSRTPGSSRACRPRRPTSPRRSRASSSTARRARLYAFVYGELCDWYLEMLKPRLYAEDNAETATFALHVLAETLALAHPIIPFVTEEIWSYLPGSRDLLMGHRWPATDPALRDLEAEAEVARAIDATQALRALARRRRRRAGRDASRRGWTRRATSASPSTSRGSRASSSPPTATSRWRPSACPAARVLVLASDAVDLEAEKRRAGRARRRPAQGDRARRGQARQPGLRRQGARGGRRRPSATSWRSSSGAGRAVVTEPWDLGRAEEHLLSLELFGMRFGLERMRRLLTALGIAPGALPGRPRRRHQRQVLDGALHRRAARGARRAHRRPTSRRT